MGGCLSFASGVEPVTRSRTIDKYLEAEKRKVAAQKSIKMLLLGAGESGKSTIAKQMKIIHMNGYTALELNDYTRTILKNIFDAAWTIIEATKRFQYTYSDPSVSTYADTIMTQIPTNNLQLTVEISHMLQVVWKDKATVDTMNRSNEFQIFDSASYFFESLDRITSAHYIPTEDDVLRSRVKSTGISETRFSIDKLNITMYDVGGQRSERKKWIHCFEDVTSVIFVVALSEYDQVLLEDSTQNRMAESLILFDSIVNSKWFLNSSIILFLNKIDLFRDKLKRSPLEKYFPEYAGGDDFAQASKFMLWRFKQANRAELVLYPHLTCATDTSQIKVVFSAVKDTLIKNSLKNTGIV